MNRQKTWKRKVKEIFMAVELERKYSKEQILEFYLNNVYYANGYYGIQAASQGYFRKDAKNLTMSEAAFYLRFQIIQQSMIHVQTKKIRSSVEIRF